MPDFAPSVTRLIDELKRLPGIGQKTAQRLAFYLLRVDREQALALSDAIREAKEKVRECSICNNITDSRPVPLLLERHAQPCQNLRGGRGDEHSGRGKNAAVQRSVSRAGRRAFAAARHRPGSTEDQKPDRASEGRHGRGNHRRDESDRRGRSHRGLSVEADQAARACASRASRWAFPWAPTSNTRTK